MSNSSQLNGSEEGETVTTDVTLTAGVMEKTFGGNKLRKEKETNSGSKDGNQSTNEINVSNNINID